MNRLLQGDVGSGKTIVAGLAAAILAEHDAQSALLAPTSILAVQHFTRLPKLLTSDENSAFPIQDRMRFVFLIGDTPDAEKAGDPLPARRGKDQSS